VDPRFLRELWRLAPLLEGRSRSSLPEHHPASEHQARPEDEKKTVTKILAQHEDSGETDPPPGWCDPATRDRWHSDLWPLHGIRGAVDQEQLESGKTLMANPHRRWHDARHHTLVGSHRLWALTANAAMTSPKGEPERTTRISDIRKEYLGLLSDLKDRERTKDGPPLVADLEQAGAQWRSHQRPGARPGESGDRAGREHCTGRRAFRPGARRERPQAVCCLGSSRGWRRAGSVPRC